MSQPLLKPLTVAELCDLKQLVTEIDHGIALMGQQWLRVSAAAKKIRERELWRKDASSWNEFCEKHGWSRRRLNELIQSGETIKSLGFPDEVGANALSEEAASQLTKVPKSKRKSVLKAAQDAGGATAKNIQEAAKASAPSAPPIPLDKTGTKIPKPALPFWERRDEVQPWLTQLSTIKCALEKALKEGDSLYAGCTNIALGYLSQAYSALSEAKKYAVCTVCQGWWDKMTGGGCSTCNNTGLLSKYQYDHCSRPEVKAIREKANSLRA